MGNRTMEDQKDARADNNLKIILLDALVGSVLYSLHIAPFTIATKTHKILLLHMYTCPRKRPLRNHAPQTSKQSTTTQHLQHPHHRKQIKSPTLQNAHHLENAISFIYLFNTQYIHGRLNHLNREIRATEQAISHLQTHHGYLTQFDSNRSMYNYIQYKKADQSVEKTSPTPFPAATLIIIIMAFATPTS